MKIKDLAALLLKQENQDMEVFNIKGLGFAFPVEQARVGTVYLETVETEHENTYVTDEVVQPEDKRKGVPAFILFDANDIWEHSP